MLRPRSSCCSILSLLALLAVLLLDPRSASVSSAVAAPATTMFEGALRSAGGTPAADGDYDVTFALYEAASGGSALWSETGKIKVTGGAFATALGATQAFDVAALAAKSALYLGVKVGADPELPRQPVHAGLFALHAKVADVAASLSCTGCVPVSALKLDDNIDLGSNSLKAGTITAGTVTADKVNAKDVVAQSVTAASFVGDGSKLTGVGVPAGACPTGQVVVGILSDGKLKCASTAGALPADGLDEVSNKLLTTQFAETFAIPAKEVGLKIPDNTGVDAVSTITVGDVGLSEVYFEVDVELANSDLSVVSISLLPPDDKKVGMLLCDPCGKVGEKSLKTTFPKPTATKTGDLSSWIGKNPKGTWNLRIKDTGYCIPQLDKVNCDANAGTDGKLLSWALRFQVQSSKLIGVGGTLVVGNVGSAHSDAAGMTSSQIGKAALVAGWPALWTLIVPDLPAQLAVSTPGQIVYRTDLQKTFVMQGKEWRELLTGPMCGDGVRAGNEVCDLTDVGGKDCATGFGPGSEGTLGCKVDCTAFDTSKCSQPKGFLGTKILDAAGQLKVNGFYGDSASEWTLCYRRSDHGANSSTFHSLCNGKGPSISLIQTNTNQVFGGYNANSWSSNGNYTSSSSNFLFSVTNDFKFPYYQNAGNAAYNGSNYGPTFGGNHDLYVESNMTTGYGNPGNVYSCGSVGCQSCTACQQKFAGSYSSWQITELEVWIKK